jgi:predicted methyltransferase
MIRFAQRQFAATMVLTTLAVSLPSFAGEAPQQAQPAQQAQQVDAPPPKAYTVPAKTKDYIRKAVENPDRPESMKVHDAYRLPAEVLQLANVKPGSRVVEFSSYGNYWSTLLSDIIGEKGELYMYDMPFAAELSKYGEAFATKHPNSKFQNIDHNKIEFPKQVDLAVCVNCFHELLLTTQMDGFHAKLYKALKPGGTYIVIFPSARDGTGTDDTGKLHRIDKEVVRGYVQNVGFALIEESRILWHPEDKRTTPVMTQTEFDLSDRTFYIYRK